MTLSHTTHQTSPNRKTHKKTLKKPGLIIGLLVLTALAAPSKKGVLLSARDRRILN